MKTFINRRSLKGKTVWIIGGEGIGQEIAVELTELRFDLKRILGAGLGSSGF